MLLIVGGVLVLLHFRDLITGIIRSVSAWCFTVWGGGGEGERRVAESPPSTLQKVPLSATSQTVESWLEPPVTPVLRLYFFNYTNADAFLRGEKPVVEERGPYVYT